jgi:uncharacterized delta-60 repeat protein
MKVPKVIAGLCFIASTTLIAHHCFGQAGAVDPTFNPGDGADGNVYEIVIQPDGKIIAVGAFTAFNGIARTGIVRLNPNGSVDPTFNPGIDGADVRTVALRNGKIVIGGVFSTVNGATHSGVARLNLDGSVDPTFNGTGGGYTVSVAILSDDKVVMGGVGGFAPHRGVLRFLPDGQVDESFAIAVDRPLGQVFAVAVQADDKTLFGGTFQRVNEAPRFRIARANADGTLDATFLPEGGSILEVHSIAVREDGKIYQGSYMFSRLNSDGSIDPSFQRSQFNGGGTLVAATAVQTDGKPIIGGNFTSVENWTTGEGTNRNYVARLNNDGSLDQSFGNDQALANNMVSAVAVQADGGVVIGGLFTSVNGLARNRIARLLGDTPTPVLETERIRGGHIVASWPAENPNWILEVSKHPGRDDWEPVATPPVTVNGMNYVTNKVSQGKFFRLQRLP